MKTINKTTYVLNEAEFRVAIKRYLHIEKGVNVEGIESIYPLHKEREYEIVIDQSKVTNNDGGNDDE